MLLSQTVLPMHTYSHSDAYTPMHTQALAYTFLGAHMCVFTHTYPLTSFSASRPVTSP